MLILPDSDGEPQRPASPVPRLMLESMQADGSGAGAGAGTGASASASASAAASAAGVDGGGDSGTGGSTGGARPQPDGSGSAPSGGGSARGASAFAAAAAIGGSPRPAVKHASATPATASSAPAGMVDRAGSGAGGDGALMDAAAADARSLRKSRSVRFGDDPAGPGSNSNSFKNGSGSNLSFKEGRGSDPSVLLQSAMAQPKPAIVNAGALIISVIAAYGCDVLLPHEVWCLVPAPMQWLGAAVEVPAAFLRGVACLSEKHNAAQ